MCIYFEIDIFKCLFSKNKKHSCPQEMTDSQLIHIFSIFFFSLNHFFAKISHYSISIFRYWSVKGVILILWYLSSSYIAYLWYYIKWTWEKKEEFSLRCGLELHLYWLQQKTWLINSIKMLETLENTSQSWFIMHLI